MVGGVTSTVHVIVDELVAVLPQASVAVNVLVCDRTHVPLTGPSLDVTVGVPQASVAVNVLVCVLIHVPLTGPSLDVTVGVPQASVAVAVPSAAVMAADDGLQPAGSGV